MLPNISTSLYILKTICTLVRREGNTMEILKNQSLKLNNVLAVRFNDNYENIQLHTEDLMNYAQHHNAEVVGIPVSTVYDVGNEEDNTIGMEIFLPINKEVPNKEDESISFINNIIFDNCLKLSHIGDISNLQNTYNKLDSYIEENNLVAVSNVINVSNENKEMDVYVSVVTQEVFNMNKDLSDAGLTELSEEKLQSIDGGRVKTESVRRQAVRGGVGAAGGKAGWKAGAIAGAKIGSIAGPKGAL